MAIAPLAIVASAKSVGQGLAAVAVVVVVVVAVAQQHQIWLLEGLLHCWGRISIRRKLLRRRLLQQQ
jgi:hypothetical protein